MKRKVLSEHDVQSQILGWLAQKGIFHYRQNTGAAKLTGGHWVRFGKKGAPDIVAVEKGRFIGIEVKKVGEEQSDDQFTYEKNLRRAGGEYILAYSLDDVIELLDVRTP